MSQSLKILLTTSDYLPQRGGLTTYTLNIETVLQKLNYAYDIFHWKTIQELKQFHTSQNYSYIIHIHLLGGFYLQHLPGKHIGIFHGSELFFISSNPIKKWIKKLLRPRIINQIEQNFCNIFISEFTRQLAILQGLKPNYARDIVFHNCIDTRNAKCIDLPWENEIRLCAIIRNTPHKNIEGCIQVAEGLQQLTNKKVTLYLPFPHTTSSSIKIETIMNMSDQQREQIYKNSHFNLLLSLDHSHRGYIEGFGLSCLEAGKYGTPSIVLNTGGLPDNIHPHINGFIISATDITQIQQIVNKLNTQTYKNLRHTTYQHTITAHTLEQYSLLLQRLIT